MTQQPSTDPHASVSKALSTAISAAAADDPEALTEALDALCVAAPEEEPYKWLVMDIESNARQMHIHDLSVGDRDIEAVLREFKRLYHSSLSSDSEVTVHKVRLWLDALRNDILEHRPNTTVISDHNLQEAFSASVRKSMADFRTAQQEDSA